MNSLYPASIFGRHEFAIRRLHSLTGLVPIGGYLCFHLATNAAVLDGLETYQRRADQIHVIGPTTLFFLEWALIFLPILFHGMIGLIIVTRGKRNLGSYPYAANWRYALQRVTGVIAFAFIFWHVFQMHGWFRFDWWTEQVVRPLGGAVFDPTDVATAPAVIRTSMTVFVLYAVGVLASVYHLANGLWTMGITWGVWTSPNAQRRAGFPCAALGLVLAIAGLGALIKMQTIELPREKENSSVNVEWKMGTGSEPRQMPNPRQNAAGSVPVPFFHGTPVSPPEKGDRHRRQHESPLPQAVVDGASSHFRLPDLQFKEFN